MDMKNFKITLSLLSLIQYNYTIFFSENTNLPYKNQYILQWVTQDQEP